MEGKDCKESTRVIYVRERQFFMWVKTTRARCVVYKRYITEFPVSVQFHLNHSQNGRKILFVKLC